MAAFLQEYLNTELNLTEHFCNDEIEVHYYDSKKFILLQMADFISNTFYRKWQKHFRVNGNVKLLLGRTVEGNAFRFPLMHKKENKEYTNSATE